MTPLPTEGVLQNALAEKKVTEEGIFCLFTDDDYQPPQPLFPLPFQPLLPLP